MRKLGLLAASVFAATAFTGIANAQPIYLDCGGNPCGFSGLTDNVIIESGGSQGHMNNDHSILVLFSSTTDDLDSQGVGQAYLVSPGADNDVLINNFTFTMAPGYAFDLADLNLNDPDDDGGHPAASISNLVITTVGGSSISFPIDNLHGVNRFGIDSRLYGPLVSASFDSDNGFEVMRQLRLRITDTNGNPVPEPATWAMMLFGFGAAGIAMRRSRRKVLTQLA